MPSHGVSSSSPSCYPSAYCSISSLVTCTRPMNLKSNPSCHLKMSLQLWRALAFPLPTTVPMPVVEMATRVCSYLSVLCSTRINRFRSNWCQIFTQFGTQRKSTSLFQILLGIVNYSKRSTARFLYITIPLASL